MRIVQFCASSRGSDPWETAYLLRKECPSLGHEITTFSLDDSFGETGEVPLLDIDRLRALLSSLWDRIRGKRLSPLWIPLRGVVDPLSYPKVREADTYIIHSIGGLLGLKAVERLASSGKPLLLAIHDREFLTGGCKVMVACDGYRGNCSSCPLAEGRDRKRASLQLKELHRIFHRYRNIRLAADSPWLEKEAHLSWATRGLPVSQVPMPVDDKQIQLVPRRFARALLRIPYQVNVMLIRLEGSPREDGADYLMDALEAVDIAEWTLLLETGRPLTKRELGLKARRVIRLERAMDATTRAVRFNAADLVLLPSPSCFQYRIALEAALCGTPVVAFREAGLPGQLTEGSEVWMADRDGDRGRMTLNLIEALQAGMEARMTDKDRQKTRSRLYKQIGASEVAKRYMTLF